jgi:hypothetical protein
MEVRKNTPSYAIYMLGGSVAFWLPSVILHAVKGDDYFRHFDGACICPGLLTRL